MRKLVMSIICIGLLFGLVGCDKGQDDQQTKVILTKDSKKLESIEKLRKFTTVEKDDKKYSFNYNSQNTASSLNSWTITFTTENEFVRFYDNTITDSFIEILGSNCFDNDGHFSYDLDENDLRIYFDEDITDIELINYSIDRDELTLLSGGKEYYVSDELKEFINKYNIIYNMKNDLEEFKEILKENNLSSKEITTLKYEDVVNGAK